MKIGFFITARLKSSRLKHKLLLDLNGKPLIQRVIERCINTAGIDGVVLCTSTNPQDSILYDFAVMNGIQFFPGSEDDVLERLYSAASYYGYDAFLSITADNPLFSIYTSQLLVDWYKQEQFDFMFMKGLPIGASTYMLTTKALKIARSMKEQTDTEVWGPFVNRDDFFNIAELIVSNSPFAEEKRLTCDFPEDYSLIQKIYKNYPTNYIPVLHSYIELLKENPEYWDINRMHKQTIISQESLKQIKADFDIRIEVGRELAKKMEYVLKPGLSIKKVGI
ncbi:MAG: NTP transferase domain-containing protein [Bacteroidales bacterium]|nr:NTP transferase domain-containing protein [Bacteroidales bacterium]